MNRTARFTLLLLLTFASVATSQAQTIKSHQNPIDSLNSAKNGRFSSLEGGYTINLPKRLAGFSGRAFLWRLTEGYYKVGYVDGERNMESATDAEAGVLQQAKVVLSDFNDWLLEKPVTPTSQTHKRISMTGYPGVELRAELPNGLALIRVFLVKRRTYSLAVMMIGGQRKYESQAFEVFDSFRLASEEDAKAAIDRKVAEATPEPLPQEPVAPKLKSDAEDDNLKGKVKTVIEERQYLSGRLIDKARRLASETHYDERGNQVKKVLYSSAGQPLDITVYGYIDGSRVSKSGSIRYESSPPPMALPAASVPKNRDPRYHLKYVYKYDDRGLLKELLLYGNDGALLSHYLYKREGDRLEELHYSRNGSLSLRILSLLDQSGNEIEQTYVDSPLEGVNSVYKYTYEFDTRGNWVKRSTTFMRTSNGRSVIDSTYETYRTIIYY